MTTNTRRNSTLATAERACNIGFDYAWMLPVLLAVVTGLAGWGLCVAANISGPAMGDAIAGRLTWAIAAMLFSVFFVFTIVVCHTLMFRCGRPEHAIRAAIVVDVLGVIAIVVCIAKRDLYVGPAPMKALLHATALSSGGVLAITAIFDGMACWAAMMVVATSCVIVANEVTDPQDLSRQLRGSRMLLYTAAALLVAGVAEIGALHKWRARSHR